MQQQQLLQEENNSLREQISSLNAQLSALEGNKENEAVEIASRKTVSISAVQVIDEIIDRSQR